MAKDADNLKDARDQLTMILSFFSRVDAKLSTVLAINTGMLATMTTGVPQFSALTAWSITGLILASSLLMVSYVFLYIGAFPNLKGGHSSVIYFKDIASRNEARFIEDYQRHTSESLCTEVLSQVWRNAEILNTKFRCLRIAFVAMAIAILPWTISLALFAIERSNIKVVVSH